MDAPLAPEAAAAVEAVGRRSRPSVHLLPVAAGRQVFEQESRAAAEAGGAMPPAGERVVDVTLESGLPGRLYRPTRGVLPVVLFFHGGGWVLGSLETHDRMCRVLARESGCAVLSVGYRRAPECSFPGAVEDATRALSWVVADGRMHGLDVDRLALAGDSAGGNIAIALALKATAMDIRPRFQLLFYPVTTTDLRLGFDPRYDGLVLCRAELLWHQSLYLPQVADRSSPLASPLDRADLSGLPSALVVAAECDPIAPQGGGYVDALAAVGIAARLHTYPGMIHGFVQFPDQFGAAREALAYAGASLTAALGRPRPRSPALANGCSQQAEPSM